MHQGEDEKLAGIDRCYSRLWANLGGASDSCHAPYCIDHLVDCPSDIVLLYRGALAEDSL